MIGKLFIFIFILYYTGCGSPDFKMHNDSETNGSEAVKINKRFKVFTESVDNNNDGHADVIITYTYDDHGNVLSKTVDNGGYGAGDPEDEYYVYHNIYDKDNKLVKIFDENTNELIKTFEYDKNGKLKIVNEYSNGKLKRVVLYDDGYKRSDKEYNTRTDKLRRIINYYYKSRRVEKEDSYCIDELNTSCNYFSYFDYDEYNNMIKQTIDYNKDGVIDIIHTIKYDYYDNGNVWKKYLDNTIVYTYTWIEF